LLGGAVSSGQLGRTTVRFNLMLVPVQQMTQVVARVLFPSLTRLRDDRRRRGWIRGLEIAAALSMPITITFAAADPALVAVLYGPRWAGTVPILELLGLSAVPQILAGASGGVFRALVRPLSPAGTPPVAVLVLQLAAGGLLYLIALRQSHSPALTSYVRSPPGWSTA
jgi:O-antigen/teichoic acid export membrane protein